MIQVRSIAAALDRMRSGAIVAAALPLVGVLALTDASTASWRYRVNRKLNRSANSKAADLLRCDVFSHTACNRPFDWWIKKKYATRRCYWAAENIAWGSRAVGGVRSLFKAWMKAPALRKAILSRSYTDLADRLPQRHLQGPPLGPGLGPALRPALLSPVALLFGHSTEPTGPQGQRLPRSLAAA